MKTATFNLLAVCTFIGMIVFSLIATIAAYGTSIIVCVQTSSWLLLIADIIVPPVGVVHGLGYWLGYFH